MLRQFSGYAIAAYTAEMGTEPDPERIGSGVRLHFPDLEPDPDLNCWEKSEIRNRIWIRYEWYGVYKMYAKAWQRWALGCPKRLSLILL